MKRLGKVAAVAVELSNRRRQVRELRIRAGVTWWPWSWILLAAAAVIGLREAFLSKVALGLRIQARQGRLDLGEAHRTGRRRLFRDNFRRED